MNNIQNETVRMQELIDRLLDLAALESRPGLSKTETIDVDELITEVIDSMYPIALQACIKIDYNRQPPINIKGERFLLSKALTNLVKNALEASPSGSQIELAATAQDKQVHLCVTDHGSGIPDYAIDKVCEQFYALSKPNGRKGSGLGLSFVKEITALHQAELVIKSAPNAGTTVCIVIQAG